MRRIIGKNRRIIGYFLLVAVFGIITGFNAWSAGRRGDEAALSPAMLAALRAVARATPASLAHHVRAAGREGALAAARLEGAARRLTLASTLVVYVYNARDARQAANLRAFVDLGVSSPGPRYVISLALRAPGVVPPPEPLPELPPNARYLTSRSRCASPWAVLRADEAALGAAAAHFVIVVDSSALGPFVPPAIIGPGAGWAGRAEPHQDGRPAGREEDEWGSPRGGDGAVSWHWTEAFTSRLARPWDDDAGDEDSNGLGYARGAGGEHGAAAHSRETGGPSGRSPMTRTSKDSVSSDDGISSEDGVFKDGAFEDGFESPTTKARIIPDRTGAAASGPGDPPHAAGDARLHLVASMLSCEGAPEEGDASRPWRRTPLVLPFAFALSARALRVLRAAPGVLACHGDPACGRHASDAGAPLALLLEGLPIGSLQARYRGVDWAHRAAWGCNARVRPDVPGAYDGTEPTPFETMFLPSAAVTGGGLAAALAERVLAWARRDPRDLGAIGGNAAFSELGAHFRRGRVAAARARGRRCFDSDGYRENNLDLAHLRTARDLWEHWVVLGQFQGREGNFTCAADERGRGAAANLARLRGRTCFDHFRYVEDNPWVLADIAGMRGDGGGGEGVAAALGEQREGSGDELLAIARGRVAPWDEDVKRAEGRGAPEERSADRVVQRGLGDAEAGRDARDARNAPGGEASQFPSRAIGQAAGPSGRAADKTSLIDGPKADGAARLAVLWGPPNGTHVNHRTSWLSDRGNRPAPAPEAGGASSSPDARARATPPASGKASRTIDARASRPALRAIDVHAPRPAAAPAPWASPRADPPSGSLQGGVVLLADPEVVWRHWVLVGQFTPGVGYPDICSPLPTPLGRGFGDLPATALLEAPVTSVLTNASGSFPTRGPPRLRTTEAWRNITGHAGGERGRG